MSGPSSHAHIVQVPSWFKLLVIAKIGVAVVVLGLAAYGATFNNYFGGNGFAFFCAIAIFITEAYYLLSTTRFTFLFHGWAYLVLSALQAIWWLACWADLASWASAQKIIFFDIDLDDVKSCSGDEVVDVYDCLNAKRKKHRAAIAATAGIGALEWILVVVSLVVFALALYRHRKSGAPLAPADQQGDVVQTESHQMQTKQVAGA